MPGLINLDFADVKAIMEDKGKAIMGTGEAEGEDRAVRAAEQALSNPLLDDCSMKGAKGVLINITASQDITLMEVDDAVNRIKEEVDEDANIIFGSSFDASLDGKIRVSIVATGINGKSAPRTEHVRRVEPVVVKEPVLVEDEVVEEENTYSEVLDHISEEMVNDDLDENVEEAIENEVASLDVQSEFVSPLKETMFDDFDNVEKSDVISDMPSSSALFKAIINKPEEVIVDEGDLMYNKQIAEAIDSVENHFVPKTAVQMPTKEPELFPNHNPAPIVEKREEDVQKFIPSSNEPSRRRFTDWFTNRSISKSNSNRQKDDVRVQEPITSSFSDDDKVNLEIPSFLRRR